MARKRSVLNEDSLGFVEDVGIILDKLKPYWPLTLRQVYYQLVSALVIKNNGKEYKKLSDKLAKARLQGLISWDAIEDRSRSTLHSWGWDERYEFFDRELKNFLIGYRRDLLQSQDYAYELWVEDHGWESVPNIGQHDFDRLCSHAEGLLPESPSIREYKEAYDTLEVRAGIGETP